MKQTQRPSPHDRPEMRSPATHFTGETFSVECVSPRSTFRQRGQGGGIVLRWLMLIVLAVASGCARSPLPGNPQQAGTEPSASKPPSDTHSPPAPQAAGSTPSKDAGSPAHGAGSSAAADTTPTADRTGTPPTSAGESSGGEPPGRAPPRPAASASGPRSSGPGERSTSDVASEPAVSLPFAPLPSLEPPPARPRLTTRSASARRSPPPASFYTKAREDQEAGRGLSAFQHASRAYVLVRPYPDAAACAALAGEIYQTLKVLTSQIEHSSTRPPRTYKSVILE